MPSLPEGFVDMVYADPPYGASDHTPTHWPERHYASINAKWDRGRGVPDPAHWVPYAVRALKPGGAIAVSCSFHNVLEIDLVMWALCPPPSPKMGRRRYSRVKALYEHVRQGIADYGHEPDQLRILPRGPLVWFRTNAIPLKHAKQAQRFGHSHEYILHYRKAGARGTFNYHWLKSINNSKQMRDVFAFSWGGGGLGFRGQKPDQLLEILIGSMSKKGDLIMDPFAGSATTLIVAERMGRQFLGWELRKKHFNIAQKRIAAKEAECSSR